MNYEVVYASAKNGWATKTIPSRDNPKPNVNVFPLLDTIVSKVAPPIVDLNKDFTMLVSQIESNNFFGKMLIGRIESGVAKTGMLVTAVDQNGTVVETNKIFKMVRRFGTKQIEINEAGAGDIVLISGLVNGTVTHTINKAGNTNVIKVRFFFEIKPYFI
jgi:GTP-binding protein